MPCRPHLFQLIHPSILSFQQRGRGPDHVERPMGHHVDDSGWSTAFTGAPRFAITVTVVALLGSQSRRSGYDIPPPFPPVSACSPCVTRLTHFLPGICSF